MDSLRSFLTTVVAIGLLGWVLWRWIRKSDDPPKLLVKFVFTGLVLGLIVTVIAPWMREGGIAALFGVLAAAVAGLMVAIIWTPSVTGWVGGKFAALYDGGDIPAEPKPLYDQALTRRKDHLFHEAIEEIDVQLAMFPMDFEGLMLRAEILGDDLKDLAAATETIEALLAQPGHAYANLAYALNRLVDWQMAITGDEQLAAATLARVAEYCPNSKEAHMAAQRRVRLASKQTRQVLAERVPLKVPVNETRIGLQPPPKPPVETPADIRRQVDDLVARLQAHPEDNVAREDLARVYARGCRRLDLAVDQLEQLIAQPNAPAKHLVQWLNLMADFYLEHTAQTDAARLTLQRIIDLYPASPAAELAENRLRTLGLAAKARQTSQPIKLGTYEQNLGLKSGPPPGHGARPRLPSVS